MGEARRRRFAVAEMSSDALDRLTESDERYFARTGRRHRLRLAGRGEIDALAKVYGPEAVYLPAGQRLYALVRVPFDGAHLRQFLPHREGAEVDVPEEFVSALFDRLASRGPEMALLEAELRCRAAEAGL